ncbi:TylF/MycF/NovP-related O-methyltransferase (plasmid) [Azospirillum sp. A26]|uniref:TylF/MycF/NovP-related O-methyltransferase n=1 Tax=Azospirillum sp. A26 TaxID=3160607 RepID=UPI00366F7447
MPPSIKENTSNPEELRAEYWYERGMEAEAAGDNELALRHYGHATRLIYRFDPARQRCLALATQYKAAAAQAHEAGDVTATRDWLVRAVELDTEDGEGRQRLQALIRAEGARDLTTQCMTFYNPGRARAVYSEAILRVLEYVMLSGVVGEILEFGVLGGWTSRLFSETMRDLGMLSDIHLFDSFDGLPEYTSSVDRDSFEIAGRNIWRKRMRFSDDFVAELGESIDQHIYRRLSTVIRPERIHMHRGFYAQTLQSPPEIKAAVVHIDCDLYQSTKEVLDSLFKNNILQDGCVLMFDDWNCNKANPYYGERRAFREFLENQEIFESSEFFSYGMNCAAFFLHDRRTAQEAFSAIENSLS